MLCWFLPYSRVNQLCVCVSHSVMSESLQPVIYSPPGSSVHGILQARVLEWVAILFSYGDLPHPGIEPRSPALWAHSLPSEPPEKPESAISIPISPTLEPPSHPSFLPVRLSQSTGLSSLCYTVTSY